MDIKHVAVDDTGGKGKVHCACNFLLLIKDLDGYAMRRVLEIFYVHLSREINLPFTKSVITERVAIFHYHLFAGNYRASKCMLKWVNSAEAHAPHAYAVAGRRRPVWIQFPGPCGKSKLDQTSRSLPRCS